ncbi:MAG: 30S ribosomal protein S19 [Candidatus Hadarchaeaceae archaeon]|nr:MAG: 30S ribosomal protein S19 [Hadesarchaea archaeon DG-33]MDH5442711.1 30S ribosomal protein S19 [Hadesarchaea archaeon]MDH5685672.1 30S ribosomal protein S19 [Hadesarchaea archaeon]
MPKKFTFRGYSIEELQKLTLDDFAKLLPARQRRSLVRGLTPREKKLIERIRRAREAGKIEAPIRTHCREMVILPEMVGLKFAIHNGKEFFMVEVKPEMVGHRLGEFSQTRRKVTHGTPGIGATRSSLYVPLK